MKKNKVFLVDDHAALRDALAKDINKFERFRSVGVASDGKEALQKLEKGLDPEIILLDLSMPEMDGYEVAEWLAANRPEIRILVMTFGVEKGKLLQLLAAGVKGIVNKDVTTTELKQAFDSIMAGTSYFSNTVTRDMAEIYLKKEAVNTVAQKFNLSEQDIQFLRLSATEKTYKEIGNEMGLSKNAIELLRVKLFDSLGTKNRVGLAMFAITKGLIDISSVTNHQN